MLLIIQILLAAVFIADSANAILNGDLVEISDYPYAASIQAGNVHRCGGSIISEKLILTAASCVEVYNATNLTVRAGSSFYDNGGQLLDVESINLHPNYSNPKLLLNNIAILKLAASLVLGDNVAIVPLDLTGSLEVTDPDQGTIIGWGIVKKQESGWVRPYKPSEQLRKTEQPLVGYWTCDNTFVEGWNPDTMFCAGITHKDNCVGDLGNPFIVNGTQLGFASETLLLCGEFPTAYVNVTLYADFINKFIDA